LCSAQKRSLQKETYSPGQSNSGFCYFDCSACLLFFEKEGFFYGKEKPFVYISPRFGAMDLSQAEKNIMEGDLK